jgi:aminopeptidase-like protein
MSGLIDLIKELAPYRSGVVCPGLDALCDRLRQEALFITHEFISGTTVNGWTVPQSWSIEKATIHDNAGNLVYDGLVDPLGVISYSEPFIAGIGGAELKKHCYYSAEYDDACVYHCDYWIKNWIKDWGFSMPKNVYDTIDDRGAYHIELRTAKTPGTMKVLEYVLPGKSKESITLVAHSCHPGLVNDDLTGIVVGIDAMRQLAEMPSRRYTYRLLVSPEHLGPICWLDRFGHKDLKFALFLESLGSDGQLALQRSFAGTTMIDRALLNSLEHSGLSWRTQPFREIVGNCETCFEAAGIEVACPSISRVPFKPYHTSHDNVNLADEAKLEDAVRVVVNALKMIDAEMVIERKFTGLVCLSNPAIGLYQPMLDPSIPDRRTITPMMRRWNGLMDAIPRYFDQQTLVMDIADRHNLPYWQVHDYIRAWEAKGLVKTTPVYMPADHKPKALAPL